jgi:hypothetical protein
MRKTTVGGATYFVNLGDSATTSWVEPVGGTIVLPPANGIGPPQWVEKRSRSGRVYYVHIKTGTTTWSKPTGVE